MSVSEQNIQDYLNHIKAQYAAFSNRMNFLPDSIERFNEGLRVDSGKTYLKVVTGDSVHSFIVKADGVKFNAGDVLKAATWKAPATNFKRGNVITGDLSNIDWSM